MGGPASTKLYATMRAAFKACEKRNDKDYPKNIGRFYVKEC